MRQYWGKHCVPQKSLRLQADVLWWLFVAVFEISFSLVMKFFFSISFRCLASIDAALLVGWYALEMRQTHAHVMKREEQLRQA